MTKTAHSYRIALHGMDGRTCKTMEMYLKGPCRGAAVVVPAEEAQIDMIDADHVKAREILEQCKAARPGRPIILLSLQTLQIDNTFFVKKPVNVEQILGVLDKIGALLKAPEVKPAPAPAVTAAVEQRPVAPPKTTLDVYVKPVKPSQPAANAERQKTAKHQSAMQLNEGGFTAFLGTLGDIDFDDEVQLPTACYDPRQFFLGYVQSAVKTAGLQVRPLRLSSIWKPLYIFPEQNEVWLDADDKQLRAFAGVAFKSGTAGNMSLSALEPVAVDKERDPEKYQDVAGFIWKLALWTSKGRFPIGLDIQRPVFLLRWPNFTRLVITPDALRIAALLVKTPTTPIAVCRVLNVKPQYVFAFISACHALGMLRQSEREADAVIAPPVPDRAQNQGLLRKILSKLRGA
ncbi:hypothetical protein PL263_03680 [Methylomonas sp. EFPC3]|uniref:hypothetical protein n=1 Tax=Methylomonas sp. EFPC3 TaxID=3021710 RepID=UPI002416EFB0|nr:hypothetical protein [Methylomonas sp. EFPC3]WFP51131.1 hypothetical protein PL263_03680 [Methylomonas sp. EFPC3]